MPLLGSHVVVLLHLLQDCECLIQPGHHWFLLHFVHFKCIVALHLYLL